jgi:hypothetical protein
MRIVFLASKRTRSKNLWFTFSLYNGEAFGYAYIFLGDCFAKLSKETYFISFGPTNDSMAFK